VDIAREGQVLALSVLYAAVGVVLLLVAYKLFDRFTPTKMDDAIFIEKNLAAAIAVAAYMLGVAVIVAAALQ
jgi:putative membrane protein